MELLWADDDNELLLRPLGRILERRGKFTVQRRRNYVEAHALLMKMASMARPFPAVLVDVVIPEAEIDGGIASNLGFRLAEEAVKAGAKAVVFLSVVPIEAVQAQFDAMRSRANGARVEYFDKTQLLESKVIQEIIETLKGANK